MTFVRDIFGQSLWEWQTEEQEEKRVCDEREGTHKKIHFSPVWYLSDTWVFLSWTLGRAGFFFLRYPLKPQSSVTPIMSSLDYSKWDKLEDSDDEKEAQEGGNGNGGNGGGVVMDFHVTFPIIGVFPDKP